MSRLDDGSTRHQPIVSALAGGVLGCAILVGHVVFTKPPPAYTSGDWDDFGAAISLYLRSLPGASCEDGDPAWAVGYDSQVLREKTEALSIRHWQFWRTVQTRPFVAEKDRLCAPVAAHDPARARLVALATSVLGGVPPFLLLWIGVLGAVPVLAWSSWEISRAGYPVAAVLYPVGVAILPSTVQALSGPAALSILGVLAALPLATLLVEAQPCRLGLVVRGAAGLPPLLFWTACRPLAGTFLLGFLLVLVMKARGALKAGLPGDGVIQTPVPLLGAGAFLTMSTTALACVLEGSTALAIQAVAMGLVWAASIVVDRWTTEVQPGTAAVDDAGGVGASVSRRKATAFWAVTLVVPMGLTLLLLELGLRLVGGHRTPANERDLAARLQESEGSEVSGAEDGNLLGLVKPSASKDVVYELKPSHEWLFVGARVRTNSLGFRGHEYSATKPPGVFRFVGIGDSVMFGWGVNDEETYASLLERALTVERKAPVEVLNLGVPGFNTVQEVGLFRERGLALEPDAVLLNYVLNDWAAPFFLPDPNQKNGIVERSRLLELLGARLHRDVSRDDYFANPGLGGVFARLEELGRLTRERNIPVIFYIFPEPLDARSLETLRNKARSDGFIYVDMYRAFDQYRVQHGLKGLKTLYVRPNDPHPNAEGHRLIAATLEPVLREVIRRKEERLVEGSSLASSGDRSGAAQD
jgi:lysophospholipase L1-like esterase